MQMNDKKEETYVGVIDGIRVIAMFIVTWFHVWQQSWFMPKFGMFSVEWIARTGFEMVNMFFVISGFCLFLPYARNMIHGTEVPGIKEFYIKRWIKIVPSYVFCILVIMFVDCIPNHAYESVQDLLREIFSYLTFTQMFSLKTFQFTNINIVLWAVVIEVQFYIVFPWIAKLFRKVPILTYIGMVAIACIFHMVVTNTVKYENLFIWIQQLPSHMGVFANGMMGALLYVVIAEKEHEKKYETVFYTFIVGACCVAYYYFMNDLLMHYDVEMVWRLENRYEMSVVYMLFLVACCFAAKPIRLLLNNKVTHWLSGISYNFFIWNLWLADNMKYKKFLLKWEGDIPPNQLGDTTWMWQYNLLCWVVIFIIAVACTYLIEKPCQKYLHEFFTRGKNRKRRNE